MSAESAFDPHAFETWDEATQRAAADRLRKMASGKIQAWYCTLGRACDGRPHQGFDYPHARSDQWPPPGSDWFVWLIISGRGAGKTRTGAEWLRKMSAKVPRMAMIGRRGPDVRGTMVEGPSGLIYVCERAGQSYTWEPSKKEFTFENGAKAFGYSAEEPDSLRGTQHGIAWLDEPAHMDLIEDVWDMLLMGLRLDGVPGGAKVLCTSTPLPTPWLKTLIEEDDTKVVRVSTYANFDNLDPKFQRNVVRKYEGTRLGRQELHGEILQDVEGAMWSHDMIHNHRTLDFDAEITPMDRIVVAIDPAGSNTRRSDETGLLVIGKRGDDFYVLADRSGKYTPQGWASLAWDLYETYQADKIVAERNYGGAMVEQTLFNAANGRALNLQQVVSRRGKAVRAEPVAGLYEQGRVHHTQVFEELESQMTEWVPGEGSSPDRVDALVHGVLAMSSGGGPAEIAAPEGRVRPRSPLTGLRSLA